MFIIIFNKQVPLKDHHCILLSRKVCIAVRLTLHMFLFGLHYILGVQQFIPRFTRDLTVAVSQMVRATITIKSSHALAYHLMSRRNGWKTFSSHEKRTIWIAWALKTALTFVRFQCISCRVREPTGTPGLSCETQTPSLPAWSVESR